ncbi:uncharacterized protein LOC112575662 [Pomacea canaliculata]|uniref:uncharacterized protein LOC112575662 n=1 Tax=Pomacea canaliculata TaxID=400727 RepID=UPI000D7366B2|nr:uncharacterized protein LOC112575662 [Pomacea canaliculata]
MSKTDVGYRRERKLDDVIKGKGYPNTEVVGVSVLHCASLCGSNSSCSSFFFLPTTGRCLLYEDVFENPDGGQTSSGARYFTADDPDCPSVEGYVWFRKQDICIKIFSSVKNFTDAYRACVSVGSRLAVLDTGAKLRAVIGYLEELNLTSRFYIGAMREGVLTDSRRTWNNALHPLYWLNGVQVALSEPDSDWSTGNPDNELAMEGCLEIRNWKYNDIPCGLSKQFICEKELN